MFRLVVVDVCCLVVGGRSCARSHISNFPCYPAEGKMTVGAASLLLVPWYARLDCELLAWSPRVGYSGLFSA